MENQQTTNKPDETTQTTAAENQNAENITEVLEEIVQEETNQVLKLEQELAELKDTNLRLIAEMQNTQRRGAEETKKARDYAISNFAKEIITVKDYLEMALKDQSGNFEMLKMGVDLTLQQLIKVFEAHQIKDINPQVKEKLDANLHQAMSVIEEHEQETNTIVSVMQKGYLLNGRVLRPAMVTVAK
ncbi:MAG: nucleotide exchange factor GrpE [Neisseriaceae bacterium]|nr:MAG: nucleotide exchange factor GrpE [Neisseriaceae bacterium]